MRELNLLAAPFRGEGVTRTEGIFAVNEAWALARFGLVKFEAGWWQLECEGETGVEEIEIRLTSALDPLMIISGDRAHGRPGATRFFFQKDRICWVTLLVSAWPKRRQFDTLRLRRLARSEELGLVASGFRRLTRSKRPFAMMGHVFGQLIAGKPLGIRSTPATPPPAALTPPPFTAAEPSIRERYDLSKRDGVLVQLHRRDSLDSRALAVVGDIFAASPKVMAVYSDVTEDGRVSHSPAWDIELARWFDYSSVPVFVREEAAAAVGRGWTTLGDVVAFYGSDAVARAPLPLVARPRSQRAPLAPPPAPKLRSAPLVSVVIPTKIRIDLLDACLKGLAERTQYPNLEVIVVDNNSKSPQLRSVLDRAADSLRIRAITIGDGFNFSRLINAGAAEATGEILLLLNDDVEPIEPGWLQRMVETAVRPDVGAVGARLLYPDRSLQHAGITLGIHGLCGHLWKGMSEAEALRTPQVVYPGARMAVTGACLAVRRDLFNSANGLDEAFPVALNDVDFCLRLQAAGLTNIYRGDAVLIHHESQSRGRDEASPRAGQRYAVETALFLRRWIDVIQRDPFASPGLDLSSEAGSAHRLAAELT